MQQNEGKVRVFDIETRQLTTIPARELAPGMMKVRVQGIEGEVWVDASHAQTADFMHPPLPDNTVAALQSLYNAFHDVCPWTHEEWEENFRRNSNYPCEIATWQVVAGVYAHFTSDRTLSRDQRKDIFDVIRVCVFNGKEAVLLTTRTQTLSRKQIQEIAEYADQELQDTKEVHQAFTSNPLLRSLQEKEMQSQMRDADLIYGQDEATGRLVLFYGKETIEAVKASGKERSVKQMVIPYDSRTLELEAIVATVKAVKGSHCYNG